MKTKYFFIVLVSVFLFHLSIVPGQSCVGRTLTIAHDGSIDQQIMSQILAVFIQERTGTMIKLVKAANVVDSMKMVEQEKANIYLSYITSGLADMGNDTKGENIQENFSIVKQYYLEERSMVWLKPFGYTGPIMNAKVDAANQSMASAVATKKTLERFPILERVINKLDGVVDEKTLKLLQSKAKKKDAKVVVKEFLKSRSMI